MAKDKDQEKSSDGWVQERLAALEPDGNWSPNTANALARFRARRNVRSGHGTKLIWIVAACGVLALTAASMPRTLAERCLNYCSALVRAASSTDAARGGNDQERVVGAEAPGPRYAEGRLVRPQDYREWIFLSSGLGMEYNPAAGAPERFTNVFVPQWAYREFLSTGRWPEKTMFVLEARASQNKGSINKAGHFQADLTGLAVEVKDDSQFTGGWGYFSFDASSPDAMAMSGPADPCWRCHEDHAAVEHTFVQFYPTLKPVAMRLGTYRHSVDE